MTDTHSDHTSDEATADLTSAFRVDFSEHDAPVKAPTHGTVSEPPTESALLVVRRGPNAGSRFVLDQPVKCAGRHPNSDIFCDDITVSRRHAEFRRRNSEFHVVDVGSLNGTYVNREPVQSAVLANGDEIQIGKFTLVFLTASRSDENRPDTRRPELKRPEDGHSTACSRSASANTTLGFLPPHSSHAYLRFESAA